MRREILSYLPFTILFLWEKKIFSASYLTINATILTKIILFDRWEKSNVNESNHRSDNQSDNYIILKLINMLVILYNFKCIHWHVDNVPENNEESGQKVGITHC